MALRAQRARPDRPHEGPLDPLELIGLQHRGPYLGYRRHDLFGRQLLGYGNQDLVAASMAACPCLGNLGRLVFEIFHSEADSAVYWLDSRTLNLTRLVGL